MFGSIGMPELIIILVIALIIFGPRKLPELGKSLGRSLNEFKKASNDLQNTLEQEIKLEEQKESGSVPSQGRGRAAAADPGAPSAPQPDRLALAFRMALVPFPKRDEESPQPQHARIARGLRRRSATRRRRPKGG